MAKKPLGDTDLMPRPPKKEKAAARPELIVEGAGPREVGDNDKMKARVIWLSDAMYNEVKALAVRDEAARRRSGTGGARVSPSLIIRRALKEYIEGHAAD